MAFFSQKRGKRKRKVSAQLPSFSFFFSLLLFLHSTTSRFSSPPHAHRKLPRGVRRGDQSRILLKNSRIRALLRDRSRPHEPEGDFVARLPREHLPEARMGHRRLEPLPVAGPGGLDAAAGEHDEREAPVRVLPSSLLLLLLSSSRFFFLFLSLFSLSLFSFSFSFSFSFFFVKPQVPPDPPQHLPALLGRRQAVQHHRADHGVEAVLLGQPPDVEEVDGLYPFLFRHLLRRQRKERPEVDAAHVQPGSRQQLRVDGADLQETRFTSSFFFCPFPSPS